MSRGLTDDFTPEEPEIDNKEVLNAILAIALYLEEIETKIDRISKHLGLDNEV